MNFPSQAIANLVGLGYTNEEARFTYIVAIHSGYFTHRQFLQFTGTKPGKHSQKFLMKLLGKKHATFHTYARGGRVYHIFSRKVFGGIERDDLPTRRRHRLEYIKTRLITVDFVLANLGYHYLETEAEKVLFFEQTFRIEGSKLPAKVYRSNRSSQTTTRYFVDRFPVFLRERGSSTPPVCFTYVDAGARTLAGFLTHLQAYRGLLRSLPRFDFLYLAPSGRFFRGAQVEFSRIVLASKGTPSAGQVLRYFELRKRWEAEERVSAADVVFLNAARTKLGNADVERQYAQWREGLIKDAQVGEQLNVVDQQIEGHFLAQKCGESLSVFYPSNSSHRENADEMSARAFSPSVSPQHADLDGGKIEDAKA